MNLIRNDFRLSRWIKDIDPPMPCNTDLPKSRDEAMLWSFYKSSKNTADFINTQIERLTRGEDVTGALANWMNTLDVINYNYRAMRRTPLPYEDA